MKIKPEMIEGPEALDRFQHAMRSALAVPHVKVQRRMDEQYKQSAANPSRRGPQARRADMKDESRGGLLRDKDKNFGDGRKPKPPKDARKGGSRGLKKKD
jgi:hypothetical protein